MKKTLLIAVIMLFAGIGSAVAQPRAIGGRIGGTGVEASYQHTVGNNMVSLDAGFGWQPGGCFGPEVVATYDWLNPFNTSVPWNKKGEWNWYMGVGAGANVGFSIFAAMYGTPIISAGVGAAMRIGVEYNFWFPLQLAVDWRPIIGPQIISVDGLTGVGFFTGGLFGVALSVRYMF